MKQLRAHALTKEALDAIVAAPASAYILTGERYAGKRQCAEYVAEQLHCQPNSPDHIVIEPNDKQTITIEMAHDVVRRLGTRLFDARAYRVVIIEYADHMTIQAQNALLKVIEEPPNRTLFLLLTTTPSGLLETIRSRCQTVFVRPVVTNDVARGRAELVDNSEALAEQQIYRDQARSIVSASIFDRIAMVDSLAKSANLADIIDWLAYELSNAVRTQKATGEKLQIMQNYFIYDHANVGRKHALMELMIRL